MFKDFDKMVERRQRQFAKTAILFAFVNLFLGLAFLAGSTFIVLYFLRFFGVI